MNKSSPNRARQIEQRIAELVRELREAEEELQTLTGERLEAVVDSAGQPYLLREAQEKLQASEQEQRQTAQRLELKRTHLAAAQRVARMGSWETDIATLAVDWTDEIHRIFETDPATFQPTHKGFLQMVHPADRTRVDEAFTRSLNNRDSHTIEHRVLLPDGRIKFVEERWQVIGDERDKPAQVTGTCQDITERKLGERRIKESEERYRALFERSLDAVYVHDLEGRFVDANPAALKLLGYEKEDVRTLDFTSVLTTEEDVFRAHRSMQTQLTTDTPEGLFEYQLKRRDGSLIWVELVSSLVFADGKPVAVQGIVRDVTERKRAMEVLRRSQEIVQGIVNAIPVRVFWKDRNLVYLGCNPAFARDAGFSEPGEVIGKDDYQMGWREQADLYRADDREVIETGCSKLLVEEPQTTPDGNTLTLLTSKVPLRNADGEINGILGTYLDITERKRTEDQLRKLSQAVEQSPASTVITNRAGDIEYVNPTFTKVTGYSLEEVQGRNPRLLKSGRMSAEKYRELWKTISNGREWRGEFHNRKKNGQLFWEWASISPILDAGGRITHFVAVKEDITERKQAEALLRESEERFRQLTGHIREVFWISDPGKNQILYVSPAYESIWGRPCQDLYESPASWLQAIHPGDRDRVMNTRAAREANGDYLETYRIVRPDGAVRWVRDRAFPVRNGNGEVHRIVGTAEDITERREAEETLREQAALLDKAQDAILVRDLNHRITYWNQSAARLYGWTEEEAVGRSVEELLYHDPSGFNTATETALNKGEWMGELEQFTKNGQRVIIEGRWTLVRNDEGKPKSILAINTDITQKKQLEAQFLRAQRMESIGTLAGGIAHDLNNVLAPILVSVQLLGEEVASEDGRNMLGTLQTCAQRGADLVKQVLAFARGMEGERMEVNVTHLLKDIRQIIRETFPKNIQASFQPERELWSVVGDPTQLHQVFMNLCVNARDAMPQGGKLSITTHNVVLDEVYAGMNPDSGTGPHIVVEVMDTGTGIAPEVRERIFEPFYTTKEVGKGTGLGLSTTLAIIRGHGGFINVYSELGQGTAFKVYLPARTTAQAAETVAVQRSGLPRGNGECVLVVDDEESIREVARKTLERYGYQVKLAGHGAEAVALYAQHREEIALIITDVAMPVMDGPSTIVALKAMNPRVKLVVSSGYADDDGLAKVRNAGVRHFVPKPYSAETLLNVMAEVLSGKE